MYNFLIGVKRPANTGEWIMINNAHPEPCLGQTYKNGDIFYVLNAEKYEGGDVIIEGVRNYISFEEYVVLENYRPAAKKLSDYTSLELAAELIRRYDNANT